MGKRGGKKGGRNRGGGGGGGGGRNRSRPDNRTDKALIPRRNEKFERYYTELKLVPEEEKQQFWDALRRDLPNSFRFTGSRGHALAVQERLRNYYIPEITSIQYEGQNVDAPLPVEWYPDKLAWYMTTPKNVIRRFKPFASFQKFLVAETDIGNITRQEVVSMIPPLVMDIKPGMNVLDLCAAPGSKSAQLLELINAGEEDRARRVAENFDKGLERPEGEEYEDDGRSTGLLIANDIDYKRAHMLVHQIKRLSSPNIIVTNHDATIFPSIKISSLPSSDGKPMPNRYLKFDRVLADVPCSGDGTPRKNVEIWKQWTPGNGLGLHVTQIRILIRALQMLKVGGRVVYSTCSMNPVEDEAVLASAIAQCGGTDIVQLMETKDLLPGLKRFPGLKQWSVMDKTGRIWSDWESVDQHKAKSGDESLSRLSESMFPPKSALPLNRAMRVYAHSQDTGAFFIAILEKKSEIKAHSQPKSTNSVAAPVKSENNGSSAASIKVETTDGTDVKMAVVNNGDVVKEEEGEEQDSKMQEPRPESPSKRKREADTESKVEEEEHKRIKIENSTPVTNSNGTEQQQAPNGLAGPLQQQNKRKNRDQPFEEPFIYVDENIPELQHIREFYDLSPRFPMDRFLVRNAEGNATKNIYYTTALTKQILQENAGKGMKFVHSGVKMFVKQDAPSPEVCPWRIQTDGLRILETWVGKKRVVTLRKKETLRKLLIEMFPRFHDDDWKNLDELGDQMRDIIMGCCVLVVEPTENEGGFSERMIFPLWKSIHSVNLMLPKEDRKAMLLRLFNDDTPLINMQLSKQKTNGTSNQESAQKTVGSQEQSAPKDISASRNTSSPEPMPIDEDGEKQEENDSDGGVDLGE